MLRLTATLLCFIPLFALAQLNLKDIRKKSYEVLVFKINAADAEQYLKKDTIPLSDFEDVAPFSRVRKDSLFTDKLPVGMYVFISVEDNKIIAYLWMCSDLIVYPVNNQSAIQLVVRNKEGAFISDAVVWVNGKKTRFDQVAGTYWLKQKKLKNVLVKIYAPNDTLLVNLESDDPPVTSIASQKWNNFKRSSVGKVITWLPNKIRNIANGSPRTVQRSNGRAGYMVLNQPKFKFADTVKLKAYLLNKHLKPFRSKLNLYLEYQHLGKFKQQLLSQVSPTKEGSFIYSFVLRDTLPLDLTYKLVFRNSRKNAVINKSFSTEDYLLDEVSTYDFQESKKTYYRNDTLIFTASAKDANGLAVLDGKTNLILTTDQISAFHRDTMYVKDTLWTEEKVLATNGETIFKVPANKLPLATLVINAELVFKNSNNESHEENEIIHYAPVSDYLEVTSEKDTIYARHLVNGKSVAGKGTVWINGDLLDRDIAVAFPATLPIDPLAESYYFTLIDGKDTLTKSLEVNDSYHLDFARINKGDTTGFILYNPYHIPVNYIVTDGKKLIAAARSDSARIHWQQSTLNRSKAYILKWQYMWAGEWKYGEQAIAVLDKLLKIKIDAPPVVFPGETSTVNLVVNNYKDQPAAHVNLTAVSYNSQFKNAINVPEPPYLKIYRQRKPLDRGSFEINEPGKNEKYNLGDHVAWIKRFGLDSMQYYKILFPAAPTIDVVTPITSFIPQVSVHVVEKGTPQEIYLLYVNRTLVYYNGVTNQMNYSFPTIQGYSQIGIRLRDRYLELDSVYLQSSYKHDLVIDLSKQAAHLTVKSMPASLTGDERNLLERSIWQLDDNYRTQDGYVWQDSKLVHLNGRYKHLAGPFRQNDQLQFFAPGDFDIQFKFEPGYQYNLSKQVTRLEKKALFDPSIEKINLQLRTAKELVLGDTLIDPPVISYPIAVSYRGLAITSYRDYYLKFDAGKLYIKVAPELMAATRYIVLHNDSTDLVVNGQQREIENIKPARYTLLLVDKEFGAIQLSNNIIKANETFCLDIEEQLFKPDNAIISEIWNRSMRINELIPDASPVPQTDKTYPIIAAGNSNVSGRVIDNIGKNPIVGVTIKIRNARNGWATGADGSFNINNIREGRYQLEFYAIGYETVIKEIVLADHERQQLTVELVMSSAALEEVVVTGYGTKRKKSLTGSVSTVSTEELSLNSLTGKAAGVTVTPGSDNNLMIRGMASIDADKPLLYVIDGIMYDKMPSNIRPENILSTDIIKDAANLAVYGARGANGVIVITTGASTSRKIFRDNAIWQPQLITDKDGKVSFDVIYPDNITGWEMYVLAMDKHLRIGKGTHFTQAFKPLVAQLNTPQFLIVGDSTLLIGKGLNYTNDDYSIGTKFSINGKLVSQDNRSLPANGSTIQSLPLYASDADTLNASFGLSTTTNFTDQEERKIPVLEQGSEEALGSFYTLLKDTCFTYTSNPTTSPLQIYAQNNTLDVLLEELDHLNAYPFYCMEQTASKLKGLLMQKEILQALKKEFKNERDINVLTKKLQTAQLFDGGWSWWENGKADLHISNYVINTLLEISADPLVKSNIRNGLLYLQNQLPRLDREDLLTTLNTLSQGDHLIDYKPYLDKIKFDSLNQHQQWLWIQVMQSRHFDYQSELKNLVAKAIPSMLGGIHWGNETWQWKNNQLATTVLAFKVLKNEKDYQHLLPKIIQYFLEEKRNGYYRNTVESASIVGTILPTILSNNKEFAEKTSIQVTGDSSFIISSFPFKASLKSTRSPIAIKKSGGGLTYLTFYQNWWNHQPEQITDKFIITTGFQKSSQPVINIPAGEKVTMTVKVNVLADAEYVMIEVPIPAGCNYSTKKQDGLGMHKEFYKNKMIVFVEKLMKGSYNFDLQLESRYAGKYTLNPAKAQLMYFPTVYGRNGMGNIKIE